MQVIMNLLKKPKNRKLIRIEKDLQISNLIIQHVITTADLTKNPILPKPSQHNTFLHFIQRSIPHFHPNVIFAR